MSEKKTVPLNEEQEYEKLKEILNTRSSMRKYNPQYILRILHEEKNLRKIFLAVASKSPTLISEISEESLLTKPTCYTQLFKLLELKLVDRIFITDVMNGCPETVLVKQIKVKFNEWTKNMPPSLQRYFLAKTSYWTITSFGKRFLNQSMNFEEEFKEEVSQDEKKEQNQS